MQHSDERPTTSSRPSLLSEQPSDGPSTRILGGLDGKSDSAPRHGDKKKGSTYGWLAAGVAVLVLGAGASTYLSGEGEKEVVLASTAPVSSTPAPAAALASEPGSAEDVSTAAILQDVPEPAGEPISDAEKLGVEDELDKMLAKEAMPAAPAAAPARSVAKAVAKPVAKPAVKPAAAPVRLAEKKAAPKKVVAKAAPAKPAAKDKKLAAAPAPTPAKKKVVATGKPAVQDTDVALLAALVAHTKATQPKRGTAAAKLKQCSTLGSVAEAEDCRARLCAASARNEPTCRATPVAKATDEA